MGRVGGDTHPPPTHPASCFMARCKDVGRPTAAVSFYPAANLRKEIKVVNYIYGTDFLLCLLMANCSFNRVFINGHHVFILRSTLSEVK